MAQSSTNPTDPAVERAVKALACFGHLDDETARELLGLWTFADDLSEQQRTAVVEQVANTPEPVGLHGAHPTHRHAAPQTGDRDDCAGCGQQIQYEARPNPQPGQPAGGWWHTGSPPPPTGLPAGWGRCGRCRVVRPAAHLEASGSCWWCST
jgi:hypothetical protein